MPRGPVPRRFLLGVATSRPSERKEADPTSAQRQLDFVFASEALSERISVRALNGEEEWGPSDHCRVRD